MKEMTTTELQARIALAIQHRKTAYAIKAPRDLIRFNNQLLRDLQAELAERKVGA